MIRTVALLQVLVWPCLFLASVLLLGLAIDSTQAFIGFNIVYICLALVLAVLERLIPFERSWLRNDGQWRADILHTVFTKGCAQVVLAVGLAMGIAEVAAGQGHGLWPREWPLVAQVALGLILADLGLYWAHRMAHAVHLFWRFHAIHHSVRRLWFLNTGRFHVVDAAVSIALSQPILFAAGAPSDIFAWVTGITAFIGLLTHSNIAMRTGLLNYVFNTPTLHRWHHSLDPAEGDKNFGENIVLWDMVFGTYFNPNRRPSTDIGIKENLPDDFLGQLAAPFRRRMLRLPEGVSGGQGS